MIGEDDVREVALALPGAYEQPSYGGRPSWRTKPRVFATINEEESALVAWVDSEEEKAALIAAHPSRFFTTPHYDGYPIVLARLAELDVDEASELVTESWRLRAPRSLVARWEAESQ